MPLEFTAIDRRDPEGNVSVVGIPLQAHEYIMLAAHDLDLKLLSRLDDYWKDTAYKSDELDQLRMEVAQVRQSLSPQGPEVDLMADLFTGMDLVITSAQRVGGYVEAIAD